MFPVTRGWCRYRALPDRRGLCCVIVVTTLNGMMFDRSGPPRRSRIGADRQVLDGTENPQQDDVTYLNLMFEQQAHAVLTSWHHMSL